MSRKPAARLVYSSQPGARCPKCGWPQRDCRCAAKLGANLDELPPARIVAKLQVEKAGRGGKTVSVVYDLPRNREFLERLAADLTRACGAGGTVGEDRVEIQGDHIDKLRQLLRSRGWTVKG